MPAQIRKDAGPGPFYRSGPELMEALGRIQYRTEPDLAHLRTNDYKIISSVLELAQCRPRSEKNGSTPLLARCAKGHHPGSILQIWPTTYGGSRPDLGHIIFAIWDGARASRTSSD